MKKIFLIITAFCSGTSLFGQTTYFDSTYNLYSGGEYARAIFREGNNYVIFGTTLGQNGALKPALIKIDSVGNKIFQNTIPDTYLNWGFSFSPSDFIRDSLGGYLFASTCDSLSSGSALYAGVVRMDNNGDTVFTKYLSDSLYRWTCNAVIQNPDYTYLLAGREYISPSSSNLLLIKIDTLANIIWSRTIGNGSDIRNARTICPADSGYIVAGYRTFGATFLGYIVKTDLSGNAIWSLTPGTLDCGLVYSNRLKDGNYLACGYNGLYNNGSENFDRCYAIKFTDSGTILWQKNYGTASPTSAFNSFIELDDSSIVFLGEQGITTVPYFYDAIILKANKDGDSLWTRVYDRCGINSGEMFNSAMQIENGNFIVAGSFYYGCTPDYWVMELDSFGCNVPDCQTIGISEHEKDDVNTFVIYPNPGNGNLLIRTIEREYSVKVFNALGEILYSNSNSPEQFSLSSFPNGIYFTEFTYQKKVKRIKIIKN